MQFKKVIAKIIKIEGDQSAACTFGHQVGEEFIFDEFGWDKKMCIYAQAALMPAVTTLLHGGSFPWLPKGEELYFGCSHPGSMYQGLGQVIFHLRVM